MGSNRCDKGSPFHTEGQPLRMYGSGLWRYEQKEQRVTPHGSCSNERSELRPLVSGVGQQRSRSQAGVRPRILQYSKYSKLQTMAPIRNMIRCWRGSQWSTSNM